MTRDQKLRALYNYVRDNFTYLSRKHLQKGADGWQVSYATQFFNTRKGNCYSFSSALCFLYREIGMPAYTYIGEAGIYSLADHCWVEIPLDGQTYIFDTQLEHRYRYDNGWDWSLFMITVENAPLMYAH